MIKLILLIQVDSTYLIFSLNNFGVSGFIALCSSNAQEWTGMTPKFYRTLDFICLIVVWVGFSQKEWMWPIWCYDVFWKCLKIAQESLSKIFQTFLEALEALA